MIISHKYKFIFIKTRKVGGTSIELFLRQHLGDTDIASRLVYENCPSINCSDNNTLNHAGWSYIADRWPDEWQNYYKFTIDRNPWDKVVSAFFYWQGRHQEGPWPPTAYGFRQWAKMPNRSFPNDWEKYTKDNRLVVDNLIPYENLHTEFSKVCNTLGIPYNNELAYIKAKTGFKNFDGYRHLYNDETAQRVGAQHQLLIDHFNYKF